MPEHLFYQCADPAHQRDSAAILLPQHDYEMGHITYAKMCERLERAILDEMRRYTLDTDTNTYG